LPIPAFDIHALISPQVEPAKTRFICRRDGFIIDGEIVAVNEDGVPSFNLLQNFGGAKQTILFYAFDLLILPAPIYDRGRWNSAARFSAN
jgi:ATP-dependent DNA ligase